MSGLRLEREDRKAKLKAWALRTEESGSSFHEELERNQVVGELGDMLLTKLAVRENTF